MSYTEKQLIIFDLDGTLAPSKSVMTSSMAAVFTKLIAVKKVAVISGGSYQQFKTQLLPSLPASASDFFGNLFLLPTSGTSLYTWSAAQATWQEIYKEHLTDSEKATVFNALEEALAETGYVKPTNAYGEIIEDRESQITFSALGQHAPLELKKSWDPDHLKRQRIVEIMKATPTFTEQFSISIGGATSIDVTRRGFDKKQGVARLSEYTHIPLTDILYIGDALFDGGNDSIVKELGIECLQVAGPEETEKVIAQIL